MEIGSFITPERVAALAEAGADYAELFVTRTVMAGDRGTFEAFRVDAASWRTPPRAFSGLLPAELKICGPDIDVKRQDAYVREMFHRIQALSGSGVVATLGSADARAIPEGFDRERALDQLADFLERTATVAHDHGVRFTLEHLNRGETNVFNSLRECGDFVRERGLNQVFLLADLYHMMLESEPLSTIAEYGDLIIHAHVADTGRDAPGTGDYPFGEFFSALNQAGYRGNCSIEAFWTDFDGQVDLAVETCRRAASAAGS
jgi:D-psicose/D-tagatose/L-ribulose 3-epimerase